MSISVQSIALFSVVIINALIATYVLIKNPAHIVHRSFFVFVCGSATWGAGIIWLFATKNFFFDKVIHYGGITMFLGLTLLAKSFPNATRIERKFWLYLIPFGIIYVAIPFNVFISGMIVHENGTLQPVSGPAFIPFALTIGAYILYSLFLLMKKYLQSEGLVRLQIQYLFSGAAVFMLATFFFDVLLPHLGFYKLNFYGPLTSILFIGGTAYAIIRHQLMDIRIIIQRSTIFSSLLIILLGFYLLMVFIVSALFQKEIPTSALIGGGIACIMGIFGTPKLERYFRKLTDPVFFKDRYEYSTVMHELSEILNRNLELENLTNELIPKVKAIFKIKTVYIFLISRRMLFGRGPGSETVEKRYSDALVEELAKNPEIILRSEILGQLKDTTLTLAYRGVLREIHLLGAGADMEVVAPIALEAELLGIIGLSRKLSGDPYTLEDLQLLRTFSNQAAIALKKAELFKTVQEYSQKLEERVKERTTEIQSLQEEQKQMIVDISHGLQTPLTVLKGELAMLRRSAADNGKFDDLEKSIDEVSRLIYDLLRLSKLESNQSDFNMQPVDLSELVRGVAEYVNVLVQEEKLLLISHVEPDIQIRGDRGSLEELLTNILSNAVKFTPPGEGQRIEVRLVRGRAGVELSVADTGIGIHKEDLENIFQRFYQVKEARHPVLRGTGLGLAIAKRIAEKHGGRITAESEFGKGAKFVVTFPVYIPA